MGDHTCFFYGTLMASPVLHRVCPRKYGDNPWQTEDMVIRPAVLHNYRRLRVLGADYPGLVPADTPTENASSDTNKNTRSSVRGTLVSGLTDEDILRLDMFEGDQYEKRKVKVRVLKDDESPTSGGVEADGLKPDISDAEETGEEVEAVTYVWTAERDILEDKEWDFQSFLRDKLHLWAGHD